jgi:hypothetical protein
MKKIFLLSTMIGLSLTGFSQLFSDNFDSYAVGSYLGPQSLTWSTWSGTEGNAEDATINNMQSSSPSNSIYFASTAANGGPQDVVLKFGQLYNSGIFTLQKKLYVNTGKKGYYNIQGALTIGNLWALNVNLASGNLTIDDGATANLVSTNYPEATWFELRIVANLTLKVWKAYIDGVLVGTWTNGVNSVASTDFFPIQNSQFYVDDVSFDHQTYTLQNLNAMVSSINVGGNIASQQVTPTVKVLNAGVTAITSFYVDFNYNGTIYTQNVTGINLASLATYTVTMPSLNLAPGMNNVVATVYNVNGGVDNDPSDDSMTQSINPVVPAVGKMVVGEEGTGTWCQWCPRGAVFMDKFATDYDGFWAGIAVHNGDPMTVADYDAGIGALVAGYPSALVDRGADVDPSGMSTDFFARLQTPPVAIINNGATWDATTRVLNVSVKATFAAAATSSYKLACVLTEDDVTGTGSGYNQSNAYAGGGNGVMGGFETLPSSVPAAQMVYDHVARVIAPSFTGYANSFPAVVNSGESHTINFSFLLPAAWDETQMHIIGMILSPDGRIDNAGTATIAEAVANGYEVGANAGLYEALSYQLDAEVNMYPNPATDKTIISINLKKSSEVSIQVMDMNGKILRAANYSNLNGTSTIEMNTENLNSGIYAVVVTIDGVISTQRLVVE